MSSIRLTRRGTIGDCTCKVGGCRKCGSSCRRCKCACDGISPLEALSRKVGKRQSNTTKRKLAGKRSTRASSKRDCKDDDVDEQNLHCSNEVHTNRLSSKDSLDETSIRINPVNDSVAGGKNIGTMKKH